MEYSFDVINYFDERDGKNKSTPNLSIVDQTIYGDYFLDEISNLSHDYLEEIVEKLNKVLGGELEEYEFGYEVYNLDCDINECKVLNTFEDWKVEATIPTKDIYQLLKDWKEFLEKYNQKS